MASWDGENCMMGTCSLAPSATHFCCTMHCQNFSKDGALDDKWHTGMSAPGALNCALTHALVNMCSTDAMAKCACACAIH